MKIFFIFIISCTLSFPQSKEFSDLFRFTFGSSKEVVNKIWQNSSYAKFGNLNLISQDTLLIRIDDFKYFDGWQFLFIKDSLYKIQMFSKINQSECKPAIEWFNTNYGKPKISGGDIYYWWYRNAIDSTINKISLSCSCFFCEPIPDSARLVIGIKNDKLYKRVGDLTVNKAFLNGVKNFKWETTSENIRKQITQISDMELLPKDVDKVLYDTPLYFKNGTFANILVNEWCFKFYYDKLYKVEIKFSSESFTDENVFYSLLDSLNSIYGHYFTESAIHKNVYYWFFFNYDDQLSDLGKIYLDKNDLKGEGCEVTLTFEYQKKLSMKEQ